MDHDTRVLRKTNVLENWSCCSLVLCWCPFQISLSITPGAISRLQAVAKSAWLILAHVDSSYHEVQRGGTPFLRVTDLVLLFSLATFLKTPILFPELYARTKLVCGLLKLDLRTGLRLILWVLVLDARLPVVLDWCASHLLETIVVNLSSLVFHWSMSTDLPALVALSTVWLPIHDGWHWTQVCAPFSHDPTNSPVWSLSNKSKSSRNWQRLS